MDRFDMRPDMGAYRGATAPDGRMHRRARWHDYRSPRIYMVTLMKHPGIPQFSRVGGCMAEGKMTASRVDTPMGQLIARELVSLPLRFREMRIIQYVIMPDHVHLLIEVMQTTSYHFNELVDGFTDGCNSRYRGRLRRLWNFDFDGCVFQAGYHDRILSGKGQLRALIDYINDNPRRLFLRRGFPDYFRSRLVLQAGEAIFSVFGNVLLLEHPHKVAVRFSSKYTAQELAGHRAMWAEAIRDGGVLVSPFFHREEKAVRDRALAEGCRMIVVVDNGFADRWKPEKLYLDACAEGRLLFVGPLEVCTRRFELRRDVCMRLNEVALWIARLQRGDFAIKRRR